MRLALWAIVLIRLTSPTHRAFKENSDERVKSMIAWALGRMGNKEAMAGLEKFSQDSKGIVKEEIEKAIKSSAAKL